MKRILGLALAAGLAITGLTACMGDDGDGSAAERRRSAALVETAAGQHEAIELTIAGITASGQAIEVRSMQWGVVNQGAAPQAEALTFTKFIDEVSPLLLKGVALGTPYTSAVLKLNKAEADQVHTYATFELTGVQITSVQQGVTSGNVPTESVSLKYASLKETYSPEAKGTKPATPTSYTFAPKT